MQSLPRRSSRPTGSSSTPTLAMPLVTASSLAFGISWRLSSAVSLRRFAFLARRRAFLVGVWLVSCGSLQFTYPMSMQGLAITAAVSLASALLFPLPPSLPAPILASST
eukprot:4305191-Pyramimonas_sp.AAC.1